MNNAVVQEFKAVFMSAVEYAQEKMRDELYMYKKLINEHFPEKKSILITSREFLLRRILRCDDEQVLDLNKTFDITPWGNTKMIKKADQFDPALARHLQGLDAVWCGFSVLKVNLGNTGKKYIARFLDDFIEAYRENPQISDVDVMIMFYKKESVMNKKTMPKLDLVSPAASAELNLGIREHIFTFIQKNNLMDA